MLIYTGGHIEKPKQSMCQSIMEASMNVLHPGAMKSLTRLDEYAPIS